MVSTKKKKDPCGVNKFGIQKNNILQKVNNILPLLGYLDTMSKLDRSTSNPSKITEEVFNLKILK